ncbi:lactosylceramide 4-alpha-galactosyltransferase-like [Diabrotica virgifera virgifera]|uniref:Lactosylceramide 4-alpha-galactosyltransferase-like n=1 Tax=Diabrotica virgifera virgifera TaxID=50390 RepID=A0A6P7FPM3_DIAVI|nr:lactosylceramide 4-alpha-galactosyltransferase-like [Diabrotica virgifera virgifera]XP_028138167.1 lactosylceramide 4-alpha-galactosyltransferase-like [Diabrotica virgifera virgifera]
MLIYRHRRMILRVCTLVAILVVTVSMMLVIFNNTNTYLLKKFNSLCTAELIGTSTPTTTKASKKTPIYCYRENGESLPDISDFKPRPGKSIFFHETSCHSFDHGKIVINSRQACAVESAAKMNPDLDVYLLYASPGIFRFEGNESDHFLRSLLSYKNIHILHLNYGNYVKGTPVETLWTSGKIEKSSFVVSHASDVLRYLTLWKYGGIYLDLDVVVLKSLQNLPLNYAGLQTEEQVAAGVISFEADGFGHSLADKCVNRLKKNFNGQIWGRNGPYIVSAVMKENCNVKVASQLLTKNCPGLKMYPIETFYPIPYWQWQKYFREGNFFEVMNKTKNTYVLHTWNKMSEAEKIPLNKNPPYLHFAKLYCPKVVEACNRYF